MEALGLGLFMISAGLFGTLLEYPGSPFHRALPDPFLRRALMGLAMALTAIGLVYSPWGRRSGAHINPAFTLTMLRLGRVKAPVALAYVLAQFAGGLLGVLVVAAVLRQAFLGPPVSGVATLPGATGVAVAFACEVGISFLLMTLVLTLGPRPRLAPYTGLFVGAAIFLYITFEAPLSGMSMNPARTLASAIPSGRFDALWIYFTAPVLGMGLAAETHARVAKTRRASCAKLVHGAPCIFCEDAANPPA
jgi:aquaporin Z